MNLPDEFIEKYTKLLGDEAESFFESFDTEPQKGFRLNPLKSNYQNVALNLEHPVDYSAVGYVGSVSGNSLEHQTGYGYSQDLSAMYVGEVCGPRPGEKILDLCAAPGGKSSHLASLMNNEGLLVSNEINRKRALILAENMERIGARNVIVTNEDPTGLLKTFEQFFDKIVVDAPCSGEGMFRKDHAATKYWHKDYPNECAARQKLILADAMKMLKQGGTLVYSTCTFAPEEDEQIITWLLNEYPYLELVPIKKYSGMDEGRPAFSDGNEELRGCVRLMMHHFKGEGHFIAKLKDMRPVGENVSKKKKGKKKHGKKSAMSSEQVELWQNFAKEFELEGFSLSNLKVLGDHLYLYQESWPDISRLKFIRPGFLLGTFKKKRFEPSYGLALALDPTKCQRKLAVEKEDWQKYVAGNVISLKERPAQGNGWYLLECEDKAFAFGKVVDLTVKNFFPKGLRIFG